MRPSVAIVFEEGDVNVLLGAGDAPLPPQAARRWLDEQYVAHDCELMRATGKVLNADKLLALAHAIGLDELRRNEALRLAYARAALGSMDRNTVRVDLRERAVSAA